MIELLLGAIAGVAAGGVIVILLLKFVWLPILECLFDD